MTDQTAQAPRTGTARAGKARRSALFPPALAALALLGLALLARPAAAVPSFADQTGQPCAACHVGAFGPQLKPYGRDFKLYGFVAQAKQAKKGETPAWKPPIAATAQTSFTHTAVDQPGGAARWFAPNNNFALDQASLYYAGRIDAHTGAFFQITFDGVARQLAVDTVDIRHVMDFQLFDEDAIAAVVLTNGPSVADPWNSMGHWAFPYNSSPLAPTPAAAPLMDGALDGRVAGIGLYALWNDLLYAEFDLYGGLNTTELRATGVQPSTGTLRVDGGAPYGRLALEQDWGRHSVEIGALALLANIWPNGDVTAGTPDQIVDVGIDATWQYNFNPQSVVADFISAHAMLLHEQDNLHASQIVSGSLGGDHMDVARADISYSIASTVTPSLQYFSSRGSMDPAYWGTPSGRPNSSGVIAEIAWVPFGKPDSPFQWGNLRLAAQYVAYTEFDGSRRGAWSNNALYLSAWAALHF